MIDDVEWFTRNYPNDIRLDGELWAGRNSYDRVQALVRKKDCADDDWNGVVFKGETKTSFTFSHLESV